jgi:mycothiol system anti-sigma-R factor
VKPHCKETLARAYLFLDGEILSEPERQEIVVHLEECAPCLERVGLEREVTFAVARLRHHSRCPDALKHRITSLLEQI